MSNLCYFEIPVDDMSRAQAFYGELFGWRFHKNTNAPAECGDYFHIQTTDTTSPEGMNYGGMLQRQAFGHQVTNYVNVDSIEAALDKALLLGGTQLVPKTAVPGMGYFAICLDLDKNPVGLWQVDNTAA